MLSNYVIRENNNIGTFLVCRGRKPCGCLVCAIADDPVMRRDIAKALPRWIRNGLTIERVPDAIVKEQFTDKCPHELKQLSLFGELA